MALDGNTRSARRYTPHSCPNSPVVSKGNVTGVRLSAVATLAEDRKHATGTRIGRMTFFRAAGRYHADATGPVAADWLLPIAAAAAIAIGALTSVTSQRDTQSATMSKPLDTTTVMAAN